MGIKLDAGKILIFVYNEYTSGNGWVHSQIVIDTTKWEAGRINRAITYLNDLGVIKIDKWIGNTKGVYNFGITGLTPLGIHMIEGKKEFKKIFSFEVGIPGVFKYSWGASEK